MQFYMPVKIYSETECVSHHKKELAALGKKALLVTGRHSARVNGSLEDVTAALDAEQTAWCLFDEIEENPSVETVMKASRFGQEEQVDFVIGIGGGSPLDASKAIALMLAHPQEEASYLYQKQEGIAGGVGNWSAATNALPVVAVPTTAGTGSEATPYAILTQHEKRTKQSLPHQIFPALALVDERYLEALPLKNRVETAVDALAHLIESYLNAKSNPYNQMLAEQGLRVWGECRSFLQNPKLSAEEREKLFFASTLGGMAISHTGTALPHALSYKLTYEQGIPHGRAVGTFLAEYIRQAPFPEKTKNICQLLGASAVEEVAEYLHMLLGETSLSATLLSETVRQVLANQAKLANVPWPITPQEVEHIAERSVHLVSD